MLEMLKRLEESEEPSDAEDEEQAELAARLADVDLGRSVLIGIANVRRLGGRG